MKAGYIFIIFLVVAAVQIVVPTQMILNREEVLNTGAVYKFKTRPVDPADPFRGKYIALDFEADSYKTTNASWDRKEAIFIYLDIDSLGFAEIYKVSKDILPGLDKDYVKAKVDWYADYNGELNIEYPFNRFYMEESKAYEAEVAVRENQRDSLLNDVYAIVYVKAGESVLKDVIINGMPIKDYVEKEVENN
ncbi:GDYXXLXY domain-containing protein [Seonamhaeicola sp.]|uniref:GDYXXLXY domain-containing protein n=1 Tax=Seonamhaeicola sp. TaxID=1912245 RepID=UPI0026129A7B|nr:GDYXXLXY domain-containing protein [Seonamhaeicola sp.]